MKQLLVFILVSTMLCWFMFTPVYRHVLIMRQAALQKEVDYLLEVGASGTYGYISDEMLAFSKQRLEQIGFDSDKLIYNVAATNGKNAKDPEKPILRGEGIYLGITYPYGDLFVMDKLIGLHRVPEPDARMGAAGMKMSEYVP